MTFGRKMRRVPLLAITLAAMLLSSYLPALAQKNEHYNSPLYSPRKYDPNVVTDASGLPEPLKKVGIEQQLGAQLPLHAKFRDEDGNEVTLGSYFNNGKPVLVTFVYFECPMLCNQVLNGLTGSLRGLSFDAGKEFDVVAISFDANEQDKSAVAKAKKAGYMERYGRPGTESGWHFLTGDQESIDAVTNAAGFSYEWDEQSQQFAHAAAIMIATPEGKLSRYLYGIDYSPKDIKFSVMESAESRVGTVTEKLLLYCYHYDPSTGKYGFAILRVLRLGGIATILGLGAMAFVFWRRNKKKEASDSNS